MNEVKTAEIAILIYLIKWLMSIIVVCIPLVIAFFASIRKNTNEIKSDVALQNERQKNLKESHEKLEKSHDELKDYVYSRN